MIATFDFDVHARDFEEACAWLVQKGARIDQSRIGQYRKDCYLIRDHVRKGTTAELMEKRIFSKLINSLVESTEIIDLHKGLRALTSPGLDQRLHQIVNGCPMLVEEHPERAGTDPRNKAFELFMMSVLARCQYFLREHATCDVSFRGLQTDVAMECKRPYSRKGIKKAISSAKHQLQKHYEGNPGLRGILALSISKLENDGSLCLNADDEAELQRQTREIMDAFQNQHGRFFDSLRHPQTIGAIVHLRAPTFVGKPGSLIIGHSFGFVTLCTDGQPLMEDIQSRINFHRHAD